MKRRDVLAAGSTLLAVTPFLGAYGGTPIIRLEETFCESLNIARQRFELPILTRNSALETMARRHSLSMAQDQITAHTTTRDITPSDRALAAGYTGNLLAEALAETHQDPVQTLQSWLENPATREVIFMENANEVGFSGAQINDGDERIWWTLAIGQRAT